MNLSCSLFHTGYNESDGLRTVKHTDVGDARVESTWNKRVTDRPQYDENNAKKSKLQKRCKRNDTKKKRREESEKRFKAKEITGANPIGPV